MVTYVCLYIYVCVCVEVSNPRGYPQILQGKVTIWRLKPMMTTGDPPTRKHFMACQDVRGRNEAVNVTLGKLNEIFIGFKWALTVIFSMDVKGIWWNASWL